MSISKELIISGIQPTNNLTIGNYFGVIKNYLKMQEEYELYIFIADLHSLSSLNKIDNINQNSIALVKYLIACGLDINRVTIFRQSDICEHLELFNVLLNNTTIGELSRMTQYKDKSQKCKQANGTEFIPTGLLTYPVLMAADILLYNADLVVVGQDQKQHLELARNLADRMNNKYKRNIFKVPNVYIGNVGSKIMDLQNPTKKMSKSNESLKGSIFLNDKPNDIKSKISSSLTDSYNIVKFDVEKQPGISNLISIHACLSGLTISEIEQKYKDVPNYGVFKKDIIDLLSKELEEINLKYQSITDDKVLEILEKSKNKIKNIAKKRIEDIYKTINLI